jgi:hypothetical protein
MKRIFRYFIVACAATMALASCDNAQYDVIENGVYISEAAPGDRFTQQIENQIVATEVAKQLTIRLASPVNEDVTVSLGADLDFIDKYNKSNGTSYQMLPAEFMELDSQVVIPAGSLSATATLIIKPFTTPNGEAYAAAVKISEVDGPVEAVSDATHIMYLLMAPHKQQAPRLNYSTAANSSVTFNTPFSPATWTIEYWLQMGNDYDYDLNYGRQYAFYDNSAPISFGECFLRWWATGALLKGPCYQNQMNGSYFDDNTEAWKSRTWYHIAYTYDGSTVQLYIDGQKNANKLAPSGKVFTFDKITLVQNFASYYGQNTGLAQIRMWDSCLPQATIQDAMNREVAADSPGLLGYWKCSEGEGNILYDSTSNGNHITLRGTPDWNAYGVINFMNPNE